ncbi:MAG: NrdH-redoxin [Bifidobacteriaceae bacterium]|jgi:glutaredoxin-like protein|nr:NrdH-redoxin [Bifidobacteriaceae bacterium]MCI1914245.1 NrdH-redoxin [Bifidobacteriaceae bacterium]
MTDVQQVSASTQRSKSRIEFYGAGWCGDCRRAKFVLDRLHIGYSYHDVEHDMEAARTALHISGQKHIPVIAFDDGDFQVEPSATQLIAKINALGLVPAEDWE